MLNLSRTLPVLMQTELTLLICMSAGHDPIAATGLVLMHAPYVAARWKAHPELVVTRHPGQKANELETWIDKLSVVSTCCCCANSGAGRVAIRERCSSMSRHFARKDPRSGR